MSAQAEESTQNVSRTESSDTDDEDFTVGFQDMLISNEGEWIAARRHQLMRLWKGTKGLCRLLMPDEESILEQASFGIFASFIYRWTSADNESDSSSSNSRS